MKRMLRTTIALALILSMALGFFPADLFMGIMPVRAFAEGNYIEVTTPLELESLLSDAEELKEQGKTMDSGEWQYVLIPENNYAVITGYNGASPMTLQIPDLLDGADVVGVISNALSSLRGVRSIEVPGNVLAMGNKALPVGATVKATSGSYAQSWAKRNSHAFTTTSEYQFVSGVVDFTGIRAENFIRVDESEVWLRPLEALRLKEGSLFFLLDPSNMYQISYYRAVSFEKDDSGFVVVHCETPGVDEILLEYESQDETLMFDLSSVQLYEGVSLEVPPSQNRYLETSLSNELGLKVEGKLIKVGNYGKIKVSLGITDSYTASIHVGLLTKNTVTIEETQKAEGSVSLSAKTGPYDSQNSYFDTEVEYLISLAKALKPKGELRPFSMPIGEAVVFSYAGIINAAVSIRFNVEFTGEIKISFSYKSSTTYTYTEDGGMSKDVKNCEKSISGSAEGSFKAGIEASLELYIFTIKVANASFFFGIKAEAELEFGELLNRLINKITAQSGHALFLEDDLNMNMLDCITVKIHFVIEFTATFGGEWWTGASGTVTLADWYIMDLHVHVFPFKITQKPITDPTTDEVSYEYQIDTNSQKNQIHRSEDCPYKTYTAVFILPAKYDVTLKTYDNLLPGTLIEKLSFKAIDDYHLKLISWHTDKSMDEQSLVKESDWPYPITSDTTFYAKTAPMHTIQLIGADKAGMNFGQITVNDSTLNSSRNADFSTGYGLVAENESFVLPETNTAGDTIALWLPVISDSDLTAIGDSMSPSTVFSVSDKTEQTVTLCALTDQDIEARFYDGLHNQYNSVFVRRGGVIVLPEGPENLLTYAFVGWKDQDDNLVTEDIQTDQDTPSLLIFTAELEPSTGGGVIPLDNVTIGSRVPSIGTENSDEEIFTWDDNGDGTATVTGFNDDAEGDKIYVSIPRTLDGLTVTGVGDRAFENNETLRSIRFPSSLTDLGECAFAGCGSLVLIDMSYSHITQIPYGFAMDCESLVCVRYPSDDSVCIGDDAFNNCRSIDAIRIDGDIGDSAFYNCTRLSSITLGNRVTSIGNSAFEKCNRLTSLSIPASVNTLGASIIYGCTKLTSLEVNARIEEISSYMFDIGDGSVLSSLTLGGGIRRIESGCFTNEGYGFDQLANLTINGAVRIGAYAFDGSSISTLTLNGGILEDDAFRELSSLQTVTVNDGVTMIGCGAFMDCSGLTSVAIGKNVRSIGESAFSGCSALTDISFNGTKLISIGDYAFENCSCLETLIIPDTVTRFGDYIISGCTALQTLSVGKGISSITSSSTFYIDSETLSLKTIIVREGTTTIPAYTFANNDYWYEEEEGFFSLQEVILPSTLRSIGNYAFWRAGMKKLTINSSVDLDSNAFYECNRLEEIEYSAGSISNYAFQDCSSLKTVIIGDAVTSIGDGAFYNCTNIQTMTLGTGLRSIGASAFENCRSLTSLTIPDNVNALGIDMILGCTALTSLSVGSVVSFAEEDSRYFRIGEGSALSSITLREGVTSVGPSVFYNDGNSFAHLTSVSFPKTLSSIGDSAFYGSGITSAVFKSDVNIGDYAFYGCRQLASVSMKGGSIGEHAFENCTSLSSFNMEDVDRIDTEAFKNCSSIVSLTIPDSVTDFDSTAIYGCSGIQYFSIGSVGNNISIGSMLRAAGSSNLRELVLRDGITEIAADEFSNMASLTSVTLPSTLEHIYSNAFSGSSIQKLNIDGDVIIHSAAFKNCRRLSDVTISCASIEDSAFMNCTSLRSFILQAGSGEIGHAAFENCYAMQTLKLGEGIIAINSRAFFNCRSLTSLAIPDSVENYGTHLIWGCTGLKNLYIGGGSPQFNWDEDKPYTYYSYAYAYTCDFSIGPGATLERLTIGEGVTHLCAHVFANHDYQKDIVYGYPTLRYVSLPASLEYLGNQVFFGSGITEISLRGNTEVADEALTGMTSLQRFSMTSGTIGSGAFKGDTALTTVTLGEGVTSVGNSAFEDCSALASLYIPDSVTSYGYEMIKGCTGLLSLSIGKGLNDSGVYHEESFRIGQDAQLERIEVREGVTRLNDYALANVDENGTVYGFSNLHSVFLPETLTYLGNGNLSNWPSIRHLYLRYGSLLLDYEGEVPAGLTVYTDYFNALVEDYCIEHNLNYVVRGESDFPTFTLTLVVPAGTVETSGEAYNSQFSVFSQASVEYTAGINLAQPSPIEGYVFYGWYTDPDYKDAWSGTTMPAQDLTLYGRVERGVNIIFAVNDVNYGISSDSLQSGFYIYAQYTMKAGDQFPIPEEPSPENYSFFGWYSEPSFTVHHGMTEVPTEDTIVYGKLDRLSAGGQYRTIGGGLQLTSYKLQEGETVNVSIPARINGIPVVSIAEGAFDHSGARTVRIPDTVTDIEEGAFKNDSGITIILADGNPSYHVDNGALYDADRTTLLYSPKRNAISSFSISETVRRIADYAFYNNTHLNSVDFNEGLLEIGAYAFSGCTRLYDVTLPDSVTTIRRNAFEKCWDLQSFTAMGITTLEYKVGGSYVETFPSNYVLKVYGPVGTGVLREAFTFKDSEGNEYTTQYNQYPLLVCVNDNWQEMSCEAGQKLNYLLNENELEDGTVIHGWYKDEELSEPWNLSSDVMPAESLTLYASSTPVFSYTDDWVEDDNNESYYGAVLTKWNGHAETLIIPDYIDGYDVVGLGAGFLSSATGLNRIIIPSSVVYIDSTAITCADGAFRGRIIAEEDSFAARWASSHGLTHEKPIHTITFVTYGEEINPIEAEEGTQLYLPVPERAGREFIGWSYDEDYYWELDLDDDLYTMPDTDVVLYAYWEGEEEELDFTWTSGDRQVTITGYTGSSSSVAIPEFINGWPVTAVGDGAFEGEVFLSKIVLPDGITEIGANAFYGCSSLRECVLPETLNVIGSKAFAKTSLSQLVIPDNVISIGTGAFSECASLYQLYIGSGVSRIDADDFNGDSRLYSVSVSNANTSYKSEDGVLFTADGNTLVYYPVNRGVGSYVAPNGTYTIAPHAFRNNPSLTSITLPESVDTIGEYAFAGCEKLTAVTGTGLVSIDIGAFFGCHLLSDVDIGNRITELGAFAFVDNPSLRLLSLPETLVLDADTVYFDDDTELTLVGKVGSSVESYADAWGIIFVDPDADAVESITLSSTVLEMDRGTTAVLTATVSPANVSLGAGITWYSGDSSVVRVTDGTLYAVGNGATTITARTGNGLTATCRVTVSSTIRSIRIVRIPDLTVGESVPLSITTVPAKPDDNSLTWSSSNNQVVTVDETGMLTAVGIGNAVITVTTSGGITDSMPVTVYSPVTSVEITAPSTEMYAIPGCNTMQLSFNVEPAAATYTGAYWSSNDRQVLDVDENGLVTAFSAGTATVTAVSKDPSGVSAEYEITVNLFDISAGVFSNTLQAAYAGDIKDIEAPISVDGYEISRDYYNVSWIAELPTEVGEYEFLISGDGTRTTGEFSGTLTIVPGMPVITFSNKNTLYTDNLQNGDYFSIDLNWLDYTISYYYVKNDGNLAAVSVPTVNGTYQVTVTVPATSNTKMATESHRYEIVTGTEAYEVTIYDEITLPVSVTGIIPVACSSAYGETVELWFETSDDSVVEVTDNGELRTVSAGTAVITVGSAFGTATAACEVTVLELDSELILPAALTKIDDDAFKGDDAVQYVKLGDRVTSIGSEAFAYMTDLIAIDIPDSMSDIDDEAFDGSNPVVICSSGSEAERYAIDHSLKYIIK